MKTIVMTGGTFGIGEAAFRRFNAADCRLILGGRKTQWPLELASFSSIRQFADRVLNDLKHSKIDALVLNAGLGFPVKPRTAEGYETTFAVNHLGHYLLLRLLTPALAHDAIVVITTSNTHDPKFSPVAPFTAVDAHELAHLDLGNAKRGPLAFESGFRAYATSKLCNLLTARAFAATADVARRSIRVIAYNPGFVPGTGLGRNLPAGALPGPASALSPYFAESIRVKAGEVLADLALGQIAPPPGRMYASLEKDELIWPETSELAANDDVARQLWSDSAKLTGTTVPGSSPSALLLEK